MMRSLPFLLIIGVVLVVFSSGDTAAENDDDSFDDFYRLQVGTLVVLGLLYHTRRDTPFSDPLNKILRLLLYGTAILTFLVGAVTSLFRGNTWAWWMVYSALLALTGSKMGHIPLIINKNRSKSHTSSGSRSVDRMFAAENELTNIECPGCSAQMEVPKLGKKQKVTCDECGLSGEIKI